MSTKHTVQEGECVSSIAHDYGLFPNTVWEYEENRKLRDLRKTPNVLLPGDVLVIPDKKEKQVEAETGKRHRFKRKGVPAKISLQLLEYGEPRAHFKYRLDIDGKVITGTTDAEGRLEHWISPHARKATLFCGPDDEYDLAVGYLNPADDLIPLQAESSEGLEAGVEQRLQNLGYFDEEEELDEADAEVWENEELEPGELPRRVRLALEAFQADQELHISGELDDDTLAALIKAHGS